MRSFATLRILSRPCRRLQLFHLDGNDGRVHNKYPVVFAPIVGKKEEAVALGVVVRHAPDDLAIRELYGDGAAGGRLAAFLGAAMVEKDRFQLGERDVKALRVALDRRELPLRVDLD